VPAARRSSARCSASNRPVSCRATASSVSSKVRRSAPSAGSSEPRRRERDGRGRRPPTSGVAPAAGAPCEGGACARSSCISCISLRWCPRPGPGIGVQISARDRLAHSRTGPRGGFLEPRPARQPRTARPQSPARQRSQAWRTRRRGDGTRSSARSAHLATCRAVRHAGSTGLTISHRARSSLRPKPVRSSPQGPSETWWWAPTSRPQTGERTP
jgi:hypothetical protein